MREIVESRAFDNAFFQSARTHQQKPDLTRAIREWFPGTRAYCHGLVQYAAILSREVLNSPWEEQGRLEDAFVVPLHLAAEEFSMGLQGGAGAHYRLFARIGEPLGLGLEDLRPGLVGSLPESRALVHCIESMFQHIYRGAGCIRVFELVGLKICEAFGHLCRRGQMFHWFDFDEHHLQYIDLHLEAEPQHNEMAIRFIEALCDTPRKETEMMEAVHELCDVLGKFWDAVAKETFAQVSGAQFEARPRAAVVDLIS